MGCFMNKDAVVEPAQVPAYARPYQPQQCVYPRPQECAPARYPSAEPSFMRTAAPSGAAWSDYVRSGGRTFVDPQTGYLSGPWAECIAWAVRFEHTSDWYTLPEYAGQDGPVGGVLTALEAAVRTAPNGTALLAAAQKLEEAAHAAEESGRPLPGLQEQGMYSQPQQPAIGQPVAGQPYYGQQPAVGGQSSYAQYLPHPGAHVQHGGPTLLGQHASSQGAGGMGKMGGGMGNMAMAAAGGVAAGVAGWYAAEHMDDIGQALTGAGDWAAGAVEDVGDFMESAFDDIF